MKRGQFISYYKIKQITTWKLIPDPFAFAKNQALPLLENEIFEVRYLY